MRRLGILGGGNMGEALIAGLLAAGWAQPDELVVAEVLDARREHLASAFGVVTVERAGEAVDAEAVLLAVKPQEAPAVLAAVGPALVGGTLVISICAGVPLANLEAGLPAGTPVVRVMPNTPALVRLGAAAISGGSHAAEEHMTFAEAVMASVGVVVRVPEKLLDAVTALSGSGPAYVFLVAEALIDAGVAAGLPRDVATTLALQTVAGAGAMLTQGDRSPAELRAQVTSPGGTTAAAVRQLEAGGLRAAFYDAVAAATARAEELGRGSTG